MVRFIASTQYNSSSHTTIHNRLFTCLISGNMQTGRPRRHFIHFTTHPTIVVTLHGVCIHLINSDVFSFLLINYFILACMHWKEYLKVCIWYLRKLSCNMYRGNEENLTRGRRSQVYNNRALYLVLKPRSKKF